MGTGGTHGADALLPTGASSALTRAPAPASAATTLARAQGTGLPAYVTAEQARAVIDAATRTRDRLLVETLWQTGGRVSEVCRLRRTDIDRTERALRLTNLKQRQPGKVKLVYVSPSLVAALLAYCRDAKIAPTGSVFATSYRGALRPLSRQMAWKLVTGLAARAGVSVVDTATGALRPATGLDFRHGAAVHQLRSGVPLSEVSQQLGHARLENTLIYARLTNAERRRMNDRVQW
jgi:integrase/recombinase XerD